MHGCRAPRADAGLSTEDARAMLGTRGGESMSPALRVGVVLGLYWAVFDSRLLWAALDEWGQAPILGITLILRERATCAGPQHRWS
jgi:hypothetical protein